MALAVEVNSKLRSSIVDYYKGEELPDYTEDELVYWYLGEELGTALDNTALNSVDVNPYSTDLQRTYSFWLDRTYRGVFAAGTPQHAEVIEAAKLFLETKS